MSSNISEIPPERPKNPTHYGPEGLYESAGGEQSAPAGDESAAPLKVQLGEHMDNLTRRSLRGGRQAARSSFEFVKRNPVPVALAVGAVAWILAALTRRSIQASRWEERF